MSISSIANILALVVMPSNKRCIPLASSWTNSILLSSLFLILYHLVLLIKGFGTKWYGQILVHWIWVVTYNIIILMPYLLS